jgi:3-oxoacyl-[acyl-carrier protein] reductase
MNGHDVEQISGYEKAFAPVALVTGASRGLGKHLASTLLNAGYQVAANYLRSEREAHEILRQHKGNALALRADVGNRQDVMYMVEKIKNQFGRLDVVINNAGITIDSLLMKQSEESWDRVMRTNLKGCFNIIHAAAPLMIASGGGHIVNLSSYSGLKGSAGQAAYSASKAGIIGLTYSAARELAAHKIRMNAVLPGYMQTEMGALAVKAMERAGRESLLNTLSHPGEVADCILSILKTRHITGQIFSFDSRII